MELGISFISEKAVPSSMSARRSEMATLGGGCFWCVEAVYEEFEGVSAVASGYAGGEGPRPTYEQVCSGETGFAEVVQVTFDPDVTTYKEILEAFFTVHDPTTPNRQGNDIGSQYRSIILTHSEEQRKVAQEVIARFEAEDVWGAPIVTEVEPITTFHLAEDYHQGYYRSNKLQPYCLGVIRPKVAKFRKAWAHKLKKAA